MNVLLWSPELKFYYLKYSMWSSLSLSRRMNVCSHGLDLSRSNPDRLINHDLWATGLVWSTGWRTRSAGGPALYFTVTTLWAWPLTDGLFFPTWGKQRLNLCQVCMSFIFLHLIVHCGAVMTNMVHWFLSEATCSALRCGCLLLLPALHVAVWSNSWQFDGVIDALVGRLIVCWAELLFCVCPTVWSTPRWAELFLSEQLLFSQSFFCIWTASFIYWQQGCLTDQVWDRFHNSHGTHPHDLLSYSRPAIPSLASKSCWVSIFLLSPWE